ncbi:MAG: esterase/lipase [Candidatus Krumholzibacteriia bacterium]
MNNPEDNKRGSGGHRGGGGGARRGGNGRRPQQQQQGRPQPNHRPNPTAAPAAAPVAAAVTPPAPKKPSITTQKLTLTAWDMARTRNEQPDSPRGQLMTLRSHQRLLSSFEHERAIPDPDRSFLKVGEKTNGSVLLIHGVSTGPGDLRELANYLADNKYNVYVLRLPDYGTTGNTISEISWESSLFQARQCFELLNRGGGKVHVVGMGFGATLAVHLARKDRLSSLILLAPAIIPTASRMQRFLVRFRLHHFGAIRRYVGWNADLMEGMDKARAHVGKLKIPVYAAQCDDDDRASPESLRFLQRKAKHKGSRFQVFPSGGHAILAAHGKQRLYSEIVKFCDG